MSALRNKIKQQQQYEDKTKSFLISTGKILTYDKVANTANISYQNPSGSGTLLKNNVPVSHSELFAMGIPEGVQCCIGFQGGNIYAPIIIGITDTEYSINSFSGKNDTNSGGLLIEDKLSKININIETSAMYQDWIQEDGSYFSKEQSGQVDVEEAVQKTMFFLDKYSDQEIGLTNSGTKALIKTCKNGDIKIFVEDDIGICINKKTGRIELYGDVKINGKIIQEETNG